jgi:hypothetical protein
MSTTTSQPKQNKTNKTKPKTPFDLNINNNQELKSIEDRETKKQLFPPRVVLHSTTRRTCVIIIERPARNLLFVRSRWIGLLLLLLVVVVVVRVRVGQNLLY